MRYTSTMYAAAGIWLLAFAIAAPLTTSAASLYIDPSAGEYGPGDTFIASIRIDTEDECMNAAHVALSYPADRLRAVDFGRGGSIFSLWAEEPVLDTSKGLVTFSGGVPGGYCGRVEGDPAESNVVGKVVFTVQRTDASVADIAIDETSAVYLNDGLGTLAPLSLRGSTITVVPASIGVQNPWLKEVGEDQTAPEPFRIEVQSVDSVFGGRYFAAFSTIDKQSGIDHYEVFERGAWHTVASPHKLANQSLRGGVQIKAIDKAGNERMGDFVPSETPTSVMPRYDILSLVVMLVLLALAWVAKRALDRRRTAEETAQ